MYLKTLTTIILFVIILGCSTSTKPDPDTIEEPIVPKIEIVGYLPDYRIQSVPMSVAGKVTELIYFSIEPKNNGDLDLSRINPQTINSLNRMRSDYSIRILLAVGGWGRSDGFAAMSRNRQSRKTFVENIKNFCLENNFDGVDYDWEFPANNAQKAGYDSLIVNTKESFMASSLMVTMALNPFQTLSPISYQNLDRIHLMSYDHSGRHSTYEQAISDVNMVVGRGIDVAKICLGLPFYGRKIQNHSEAISYSEIITRYHPLPGVDEADGYYFNGIETVQQKAQYALNTNLSGIMVWEIGQDTQDDVSLLHAIYEIATNEE